MPEPEQARPLYFLPELNRNRFADGQNRNRFFLVTVENKP